MKRALMVVIAIALAAWCGAAAAQVPPLCHESAAFRVVEQPARDGPGADMLVRARAAGAAAAPACRFDPKDSDFVIRHRDAERVKALVDSTLVLDNGTGPDGRRLIVWDLQQRKVVFESHYSKLISADAQRLVFWRGIDTAPTPANCPQLEQWRAQLLGAAIEAQVQFGLKDGAVLELPALRCVARQ